MKNILGLALIPFMLIAACSSTTITAMWRDSSYQGPPRKIMVVGVAKKPVNRRIFEEEFVRKIKEGGTDAVASFTVLPDKQAGNQPMLAEKVRELNADAVLITRFVSRKTVRTYVPGTLSPVPYSYGAWRDHYPAYYGSWPDYYGYGSRMVFTPGYVDEDEYALMETNLYGAADSRLLWSASSQTEVKGSDQKMIRSFIGMMVHTMKKQNLL